MNSAKPNGDVPRSRVRQLGLVACALLALVIAASGVTAFLVQQRGAQIGFDIANAVTVMLIGLSMVALALAVLILILVQPGKTKWQKLAHVALLGLAMCGVAVAAYSTIQVDGFSGRLVPIVRWRWDRTAVPLEESPQLQAGAEPIDLATTTPSDFPQFLGPNRNLDLPEVRLQGDWQAHPPELLWRHGIGAGWSGFSVVNGYAVTLEQRGEDEVLSCYEAATGQLVWAHSVQARHETFVGGAGPRSTPTIDGGQVFALGATGILRCVDGSQGKLIWQQDLLELCGSTPKEDLAAIAWGRSASPLVVDQRVIVPLGGPRAGPCTSLVAFNRSSGELLWKGGDQQIGYASPALATLCRREQILIMNESSVSGHTLDTGAVLWSYPWEGKSNENANCSQPVPLGNDRVLLSNRQQCEAIQLRADGDSGITAESIWLGRGRLKTKFTNVVIRNEYAYGLSDGLLECVDTTSGKRMWRTRKGDYGHGQLLAVGHMLLVQAEEGEVVLVELSPDKLVELGRIPALSDLTWNTPCLAGSLLLVRNRSEAACYRLALEQEANQK